MNLRPTSSHQVYVHTMNNKYKTSTSIIKSLLKGFVIGTGFIITTSLASASSIPSEIKAPNFTPESNPYLNTPYQNPTGLTHISVSSVAQLMREIKYANNNKGNVLLEIEDGVYQLDRTLDIKADYIVLVSKSGHPENVIIQGGNLQNAGTPVLIKVFANHFSIDGITLQNAKAHLIQIAGEDNADYPVIRNCILQDSYQQLVKISYDKKKRAEISADFGLIENSIFRYTDGIGPNYYIGGIDLHAGNSWVIRNNKFKDIASPGHSVSEHAIHAWTNSYNTIVENNVIEDCDRGIGFGLFNSNEYPSIVYQHKGGSISNNLITHSRNNDPFADVGIILEDSADTLIENNRILLEHNYPNAIEYRFPSTHGVIIKNNITNKNIVSRNGATADLSNNKTNAKREEILGNQ
jgi:hypothetical protein